MARGRKGGLAVIAAALSLGLTACGSGGGTATVSIPSVETPQKAAPVPASWTTHVNYEIGYTIGIPPGWKPVDRADSSLIRSPDRLVAISITADRTDNALGLSLEDFATRTLSALPGYQGGLNPSSPRPFGGTPLDAVEVRSEGTEAQNGVRQDLTLFVLRRDTLVNYTAVVAENAQHTTAAERSLALRVVRSLRDSPPAPPPGPSNGVR